MIHYIAGYADAANILNRKCSLAGVAKMNYIIRCLEETAPYVVYSTSQIKNKHERKGIRHVKYRFSIPSNNKYGYYFDLMLATIQLVWYLLRVPSKDTVLVYHERWYMPWIKWIHKIKKWKLIYEVEEIYCAVAKRPQQEIDKEVKHLEAAEGYLLSTKSLKDSFTLDKKPYAVVNGVYMPLYQGEKLQDGKKHIVYAGSLNRAKGAWIAIEAMKSLSKDFVLHVSGAGTEKDVEYICNLIQECNVNDNIIYEGCMPEEAHLKLLQECEIGLCPANPTAAFPSKILEYMRNGMKVISVRKPEIESAECSEYLYFFQEDNVADFVSAVMTAVKDHNRNQEECMRNMHAQFLKAMKEIVL